MSTASEWSAEHPLARFALSRPRAFDFFQLVHLVERLTPAHAPLGRQGPPRHETIRLRPALNLGFPTADIDSVAWRVDPATLRGQLEITTTFLGLYGSDSPLPTHFTERLLPEQEEDQTVRAFLDLFHHRLLSLLYRVWEKYRYYVSLRPAADDPISIALRGLLGVATPATAEQLRLPPLALFRYAGLISQRPRSAAGLEGLLRDYFSGIECQVLSCVGRWLPIEPAQQNRLGQANCGLGAEPPPGEPPGVMLLGERKYDRSGKFRIRLGPVGLKEFTQFVPTEPAAAEIRELVRFYLGDPLDFDIEVVLRGEEAPELQLSDRGVLGRLGWTSWAQSRPGPDKSVIFS